MLICRSGHRAQVAHRQLSARGFANVQVLPGGIMKWRAAGKPLKTLPQTPGARIRKWSFRAGIVLVAAVLAYLISPWFLVVPAVAAVRWITGG